MSLKDAAIKVLKCGTPDGTTHGTGVPRPCGLSHDTGNTISASIDTLQADNESVPLVPAHSSGTDGTAGETGTVDGTEHGTPAQDPFLKDNHGLFRFEPVGNVWLAQDEDAARSLDTHGIPAITEDDARWILQAKGHEARLHRLFQVYGKRHGMTSMVMSIFSGTVTNIREA